MIKGKQFVFEPLCFLSQKFHHRISVHQMPDVVSQTDTEKPVLQALLSIGMQYIDPITNLIVQ